MSKNSELKSHLVNIENLHFTKDELEKRAWKRDVLEAHIKTTLDANKMLDASRAWRKRLERSWDGIREVTNTWSDYENRFKDAIHNLSVRIEEFEKDQENKKKEEDVRQDDKKRKIKKPKIAENEVIFQASNSLLK